MNNRNWPVVLRRSIIALTALVSPLTVTSAQSTNSSGGTDQPRRALFVTVSGGAFYTVAGDNWYANAGLGIGRDFGRYIALEIDVFHSPLETPASYFGGGSKDVYFKTPITTLTAAARVTLPFIPVLFVGAGAGVLRFDGSKDESGSFTTATNMWIVGVQKTVAHRVFTRVEGHHRADRHPPFNGINGGIIGVVGFRF